MNGSFMNLYQFSVHLFSISSIYNFNKADHLEQLHILSIFNYSRNPNLTLEFYHKYKKYISTTIYTNELTYHKVVYKNHQIKLIGCSTLIIQPLTTHIIKFL